MYKRIARLFVSTAFLTTLMLPISPVVFADSVNAQNGLQGQENAGENSNGQAEEHANANSTVADTEEALGANQAENVPQQPGNSENSNAGGNNAAVENTSENSNTAAGLGNANVEAIVHASDNSSLNQETVLQTQSVNENAAENANENSNLTANDTPEQSDSNRQDPENHKVTICHRTNSNNNPYITETVDTDSTGGGQDKGVSDHTGHTGPVWNPNLKAQHTQWGDIIPPYTDDQGVSYAGMNWSAEGQAIYNNGCKPAGGQGGDEDEGGRGGDVLGTQDVASVLGASDELPNTGTYQHIDWWSVVAVVSFLGLTVYWRQYIASLLPTLR
jgi:hypothetical protein